MTEELQPLLSPIAQAPDDVIHDTEEVPQEKTQWIIVALFVGSFLSALDTTIVTTLLPTIASELGASNQMSWIATSYLLSCSAFQPLYGKLSDVFGRKPLLIWSNLSFAFGCLICGAPFTKSLWILCLGRFISGIGGGGLTTLSTITTSDIIPLRQRGVYQGIGNIVFSLGCASGSLIGAILQQKLGWRWAFLVQIPLALTSAVLIVKLLHLPKGSLGHGLIKLSQKQITWADVREHVDFVGSFTLITAMFLLMMAISLLDKPSQLSLNNWIILLVLLAGASYKFVATELSIDNPMVPLSLLGTNRTVLASSLTNWFCTLCTFSIAYYIPVFWQTVYHFKPWEIGVRTISNFFGIAIGSMGTGLYMKRTGKYKSFSNILQMINLLGVLGIFLSSFNNKPVGILEYFLMFVPGLGYASMLTVTLLSLIASVDPSQQAQVTSIQYAFRATGSTLGVSIAGLIYQCQLKKLLLNNIVENSTLQENYSIKLLKSWCSKILENNSFDVSFDTLLQKLVTKCFQGSNQFVMFFAVIMCFLGFMSSLFMREHVLHTSIERRQSQSF